MPTVSLAISRCWITLASDLDGDRVISGTVQNTPAAVPKDGDLRHYAGGRSRYSVRDQDDLTLTYTFIHVSPADIVQLLAWRGETVLLRTMDGQRAFCAYQDVPYDRSIGSVPDDDPNGIVTYDAEIQFLRVTYNEEA